jgi:hypothetical protein
VCVHPNGDDTDDQRADNYDQAKALADDFAIGFDPRVGFVSHKSTPEKEQPGTQSDQNPKRKIHQGQGAKVSFDFSPNKDSSEQKDANDSEGDTEHPSREE